MSTIINSVTPKSFNEKNIQSFGSRVTVGSPDAANPLDCFFRAAQDQSCVDRVSLGQKQELHSAIKNLIREQIPACGPLNPSLAMIRPYTDGACCHKFVANQLGKPPSSLSIKHRNWDFLSREDEKVKWVAARNVLEKKFGSEILELNKKVMSTDNDSPEFVKRIIEMNNFLSQGTTVNINTESKRLEQIVNSDEATIFLFNHPAPPDDLRVSYAFISKLYETYDKLGKTECCPRPKYILSNRIMATLPPKLSEAFERVEAVGVDAGTYPNAERAAVNNKIVKPVVDGFINDENHIFIFPEGGRPRYKDDLHFSERFQYGIAKIITKALEHKERVKVVSVGLDYKDGQGSVHIGNPICFEKDDYSINVSKGNITPKSEAAKYNLFYKKLSELEGDETLPVTFKGMPILPVDLKSAKLLSRLIAGVLVTDLDISSKLATKKLNEDAENP